MSVYIYRAGIRRRLYVRRDRVTALRAYVESLLAERYAA